MSFRLHDCLLNRRTSHLLVWSARLLVLIMLTNCRAAMAARPNIVLIFTDDQGINDVSCYGSEIPTPHIDSLARDGMKFTQWYSASSICTPSRYGLLTGTNPSRSQDALLDALMFLSEEHRQRGIHPGETTIASMLSSDGYRTALIGKWHLGHGGKKFLPTHHGFDSFFGHTGGCVDFYTMRYGNTPDWYRDEKIVDITGYATNVITDEAIRFLDRPQTKPFFLYLSYNAPHFGKGWNDGESKPVNQLQPPPADLVRVSSIQDITRRKYAAKVVNLDDAIGRVLASIKENDLAENTIVVFLTDHGGDPKYGGDNAPFRGQKATLFEGGIRVPCLVRWPGVIRPGSESDAVLWSVDIAPTLCAVCDVKAPALTDGTDFSSLLRGEAEDQDRSRTLFWELGQHRELARGRWTAIREGNWKYVRDNEGQEFLFDIAADKSEQTNLLPQQGAVASELRAKARRLSAAYQNGKATSAP